LLAYLRPYLPFTDLSEMDGSTLRGDLVAAIAVTVMSVPQGVAYALIAGLPPVMGLYAGALPAIIGSLFRSSRHVVTGPTNSLSLLMATSAAAQFDDPAAAAIALALLVGVFQLGAGLLKLGGLVDYISTAVVTGYITGAGVLIGVGQLPNITQTDSMKGTIVHRLWGWAQGAADADLTSVALGLGTAVAILGIRRIAPKGVGALVAIGGGIVLSWTLDLGGLGVTLVRDLAPVPSALPPITVPHLDHLSELVPVAIAAMVLSLVESTSVARALAAKSGQRLDVSAEFTGMGLANIAAAFFGAYPVSGSLSRSALNHRAGAHTRLAGMLSGAAMLLVLLFFGPVVDHTPIPSLAGLLLVVAYDLVDVSTIKHLLKGGHQDRFAFLGTVVGTWALPLDQAIYLGVGISIVLFLRRARLLMVRELWIDEDLRLHEVDPDGAVPERLTHCRHIHILHIEGPLFFGAANELNDALHREMANPEVKVLIVRLKRAQGLDFTTGSVLTQAYDAMQSQGRHLILVGMREAMMTRMENIGVVEEIADDDLFPTQPGWFVAMNEAMARALELVGDEHSDDTDCHRCPVVRYVEYRQGRPRMVR